MKKISLSAIIILFLLLSGCSTRALNINPAYINQQTTSGWQQEVDELALPLIEQSENIGITVGILSPGGTAKFYNYGYANLVEKKPITSDTIFAIGSSTKALVSALMLALEHKGLLSLDESIADYLPAHLTFDDKRIAKLTFRQLATHTSGLRREPKTFRSGLIFLRYLVTGKNLYSHLTTEYLFNYLQTAKLKQQNGKPAYSNIGVGLLAYFLTVKFDKSLEELLATHVLKPLNMLGTKISIDENNPWLAAGHSGDQPKLMARNRPLKNWQLSEVVVGTGGAYSTARNLMNFLRAHLGMSNSYLDPVLTKPQNTVGISYSTVLGWNIEHIPSANVDLYYSHGMISGFNCYLGFEPKSKSAIVVLRNNFNWRDTIGHQLLLRLSQQPKQKVSYGM